MRLDLLERPTHLIGAGPNQSSVLDRRLGAGLPLQRNCCTTQNEADDLHDERRWRELPMSLEKEKTKKETVFDLDSIKRFDRPRFNVNTGLSGCVLLGER
jgi:hypothetical protein